MDMNKLPCFYTDIDKHKTDDEKLAFCKNYIETVKKLLPRGWKWKKMTDSQTVFISGMEKPILKMLEIGISKEEIFTQVSEFGLIGSRKRS